MNKNEEVISLQKQSWNKFSRGWQKRDEFIQKWMGPIGNVMLEKASLKEGDKVIDAATGTGEPGLSAAKIVGASGEVVGTDVAEDMIKFAEENAKLQGLGNYKGIIAQTSALPFEDNSFDGALSRFGVIFSPDVVSDIKELMRVIKPGSKISAAAWAEQSKNDWATIIPKIINEVTNITPPSADGPGIFRCAKPDSLTDIFKEAGLKDVDKVEVTGKFYVDAPEQYWEVMLDIAAPIAGVLLKVDDVAREEIHRKTIKVLTDSFIESDRVAMPWSAWVVYGTK